MEAGTLVAIYAAVVATAGVGWNIYTAWSGRAFRVRVAVRFTVLHTGSNLEDAVSVEVVNTGERQVKLVGAGLMTQDGSGKEAHPSQGPLSRVLEPGHDASTWFLSEELERAGFDLDTPLVGWARLATGETILSKPVTVGAFSAEKTPPLPGRAQW